MNICSATYQDSFTISSLYVDVQRLHAEHHPGIFKMPAGEGFADAFFAEMLADSAIKIFIAEEDDQAVGYMVCKLIERPENPFNFSMRYLLVDQISVRPQFRRKRVGEALLAQADALARQLDVKRIQLDSWDFNLDAHTFFEQMGFRKVGFRFWKQL